MTYVYLVYFLRKTSPWERLLGLHMPKELHGIFSTEEKAYEVAQALEKGEGVEATRVERWRLD